MKSDSSIRMMAYAAMFAALIAAGAFLAIPIGVVPIVLQNLFVFLAGLLLGKRWGLWSVAIYLLTGAVGLPVFAGGAGGIARFAGPTGGYLIGYLPAVWLIGWISESTRKTPFFQVAAMVAGSVVVYACGVSWLKVVTHMNWPKAMAAGCYPFLPGDALKIAAAIPITKALRGIVRK